MNCMTYNSAHTGKNARIETYLDVMVIFSRIIRAQAYKLYSTHIKAISKFQLFCISDLPK